VWLKINNATNTTTVYLDSTTPPGHTTNALQSISGKTAFTFRNGVDTKTLNTFLILINGGNAGVAYLDDIYIDTAGENLANPLAPLVNLVNAANDSIEVPVQGAMTFNPLANDATTNGAIDPASLQIVTPPTQGTATVDPTSHKILYRHTGTTTNPDSFTYSVSNFASASGTATVNVNVSNALRLANNTIVLPDAPIVSGGGSLQIIDALPALTFPGAVGFCQVPGSPQRLIVGSTNGSVWMVPDTTVASPVKKEIFNVASLSNFTRERSIYGLTCHPGFGDPGSPGYGKVFVNYQGKTDGFPAGMTLTTVPNTGASDPPGNTVTNRLNDRDISCTLRVASFTISPANLNTLLTSANATDLANAKATVLATEIRYINLAEEALFHSINDVHFGPDGYLYASFGDEGEQGEPYLNAQRIIKDQYSSIIRIDVDRKPENLEPNPHYAVVVNSTTGLANFKVPADNPFVGENVTYNGVTYTPAHPDFAKIRTEMFITGLRNPFKFDIDPPTGDVWVGDVGKDLWEEVSKLRKGDNAGWSYWEGNHLQTGQVYIQPAVHTAPVVEYAHGGDGNSVTGGLLYRGSAYPSSGLNGKYIFGDYGSGKVWTHVPGTNTKEELSAGGVAGVADFDVDPVTGEILVMSNSTGRIFRLHESAGVFVDNLPQTLSATGAFADLTTLTPNPGVVPYEPNLKFWSDHADKSRFFIIKNLADKIGYSRDDNWAFPVGLVMVKHFDMDLDRDHPGTNVKRLETRFLVRNAEGVYGISYKWNAAGTDATIVPPSGNDFDLTITEGGTTHTQRWHIPTRAECINCHNQAAGYVLSLTTQQMNRPGQMAGANGHFLSLLSQSGYLENFTDDPNTLPKIHRPDEAGVSLEERVRSYLTVNCMYCHRDGGGGSQSWGSGGFATIEQMGILYGQPLSETYHKPQDRFIIPGNKADSVIYNRIQARGAIGDGTYNGYSQMPPLASNVVDDQGVALLAQWIDQFANVPPTLGGLANTAVSENAPVGTVLGTVTATDPDTRGGFADNSAIRFSITGGDPNHLFKVDPVTGQVTVNGLLDYEIAPQQQFEITATDAFAPNPKTAVRAITIDLTDVPGAADATADANHNGIPDAWESTFNLTTGNAALDTDKDGERDFFEYLGGGNPNTGDKSVSLQPVDHIGGAARFVWRVRNGLVLGTDYLARTSPDLTTWHTLTPAEYTIVSVLPDGPGFSKITLSVPTAGTRLFFELSAP
jgi:glucose/arabinose dehydrogenase